jgi:hypothetical protein
MKAERKMIAERDSKAKAKRDAQFVADPSKKTAYYLNQDILSQEK